MKRFTAAAPLFAALMLLIGLTFAWHPNETSAAAAAAQAALPYDDIRNNYATDAILNMTKLAFITGTGDRRFEPDKAINRAEFMTMIDRLLGMKPVSSAVPAFGDVPKSAWFYEWVQPAVQLNIAQGISPAAFEPNRPVSREEAAVILARALKQPAISTAYVPDGLYNDQEHIHTWALSSVYRLGNLGMVAGDNGNFRPQDSMTRQEAAVLMNRLWTHAGWSTQLLATPPATIQLGWQYAQTTQQFEQQVQQSIVNTLSPRWYYLGKTGTVEDHTDASLVVWAHKQSKQVWAMVGNHADQAATHQMLSDLGLRQAFVRQLADRVRQYSLDGINIDFENMLPQDRDSFTAFIAALHLELKTIPATLSVNVSPDFGSDWTEVFDYAALNKNADYIVLMGYDEHWGGDPVAGSVASLPWVRQGLTTLLKQATASKIILALPLYTRDWTMSLNGNPTSADIDLRQQTNLVTTKKISTHWDDQLGQYTAVYGVPALLHRMWLEDSRSLSLKVSLAESNSLAGNAYWYMGGETADIWPSLQNQLRFSSYTFS